MYKTRLSFALLQGCKIVWQLQWQREFSLFVQCIIKMIKADKVLCESADGPGCS